MLRSSQLLTATKDAAASNQTQVTAALTGITQLLAQQQAMLATPSPPRPTRRDAFDDTPLAYGRGAVRRAPPRPRVVDTPEAALLGAGPSTGLSPPSPASALAPGHLESGDEDDVFVSPAAKK